MAEVNLIHELSGILTYSVTVLGTGELRDEDTYSSGGHSTYSAVSLAGVTLVPGPINFEDDKVTSL